MGGEFVVKLYHNVCLQQCYISPDLIIKVNVDFFFNKCAGKSLVKGLTAREFISLPHFIEYWFGLYNNNNSWRLWISSSVDFTISLQVARHGEVTTGESLPMATKTSLKKVRSSICVLSWLQQLSSGYRNCWHQHNTANHRQNNSTTLMKPYWVVCRW